MKTRKGEPVIVVPEEQQQIVELERQLADERKEHLETWKRLKQAEVELRRWRGCPSCKEDHDDNVMCPPHEVRTSGRAWFHTQARKWAERAEQAEAERDELQRKLAACQCETRVLNESMLIEARQERDQLRAELATMREALELVKPARQDTYGWQRTDGHIDNCGCDWCVVNRALATTPHAAKAAERVKKLEEVAKAVQCWYEVWKQPFPGRPIDEIYGAELALVQKMEALDALDKPEVQGWKCPNPNCINGAEDTGGVTPWDEPILIPCPACQDRKRNAAAYTERVRATGDVVKEARHFYGHYGPLNDALDRLDALDKPEVQE